MTLILKQLFNFIALLNSETGTNQIAAGIACGFLLGCSPLFSLQTLLIILIILFFRVQIGAASIAAFFFSFLAYLLDSVFHDLGSAVLETNSLRPLFTILYNMPILPYTRFYNSIVMGAGIFALLVFPLIFWLSRILVNKYRERILLRYRNSRFWLAVKASRFYKWYAKYKEIYQ